MIASVPKEAAEIAISPIPTIRFIEPDHFCGIIIGLSRILIAFIDIAASGLWFAFARSYF